jgi:hypothetical protein
MDTSPASLSAARSPSRPSTRLALPLLAVVALLGLVFLLPTRDEGAVRPGAADRLSTVRVELDQPPDWARDRGRDEIVRCLDRMSWGSHASVAASREVLAKHAGQLAPELLARLALAGDHDPPLVSKLVELLGAEDPLAPGVLDELVRRALSFSALEAKAALRVLAHVDHPRSLNAIHTRLLDTDPDVVGFARGAIARLAQHGNAEARDLVLQELERDPVDVDLAYLTAAAAFPADPQTDAVLQKIAARGGGTVRLVALTGLVARDDPEAVASFEEMLREGDFPLQTEVLRATAAANRVLGQDQWETILRLNSYSICVPLVNVLLTAFDTGHPSAARAMELLERAATDRTCVVQSDVLDALYARRHPDTIEGVRRDLQDVVGVHLGLVVDRILRGPDEIPSDKQVRSDLAELALQRLERDSVLSDADRATLLRLLVSIAPARGADALVNAALGRHVSPLVAEAAGDLLPAGGEPIIERLGRELGSPQADLLMVFVAAQGHSGATLPSLERLLCSTATEPRTRQAALDALGLVREGPREAVLRQVLDQCLRDEALRQRAQLVFWNYL